MKKFLSLLVVFAAALMLVACGNKTYEIAVVTDVGQLNDGGFNQGTYEGAVNYAKAHNISYKYYQPANGTDATDNDRIAAMRQAIENGAKVIVTPGFLQATALSTVAAENPDVKFIFIDGWALGLANVTAVSYKEEESGFLAGYVAVMDGYTKLGGTFGGGGSNAACNRFAYGYVQGIQAAASKKGVDAEVRISFQYGDAFSATPELQTQISGWYNKGTEIVFSCGGSMLQSVKAAAEETKEGKIIGVDVDQSGESERVMTSAVKGLAASVEKILGELYDGKWDTLLADKCSNLGAADDATGLPTATWRFKTFTVDEYKALFADLKAGKLNIDSSTPDSMKNEAFWVALSLLCSNVTILYE